MFEDPLLPFERAGLAREFEAESWIGEDFSAPVYRAVHSVTGLVVALTMRDRRRMTSRVRRTTPSDPGCTTQEDA